MRYTSPLSLPLFVIAAGLLASGCARPTSYAALLPRPIELRNDNRADAQAPKLIAPAAPPNELMTALHQDLQQARKGDADFASALALQRKMIQAAHNAAPMSEAWIAAQQGLSALEALRAPTIEAQTQLDARYLDARTTGIGVDAITATRAEVSAIVAQQDAILTALSASLSQISTVAH